jgi:glucose-6-phosphate dehydrogenase assembly protein OpcA
MDGRHPGASIPDDIRASSATTEAGAPIPGVTPLGLPILRWSSRTHSIDGVEAELARIWSSTSLTKRTPDGVEERHVAARTSVMNLVVIAGRPEVGEHCAATIRMLTGRHPSRTLIVSVADPDGPRWLDAQVQAHCMLPREDAAETCAELIYLTAGGETGRHLRSIVAPLVVHDLPVTLWWPGEPPLDSPSATRLLDMSDRLVVDGSTWSGDGLDRLRAMERVASDPRLAVCDFALLRQSRWREAIASSFDRPELRPFVTAIRSIGVRYAARDLAAGATNVVKPVYHAAWLASRLGMTVEQPLVAAPPPASGYAAVLRAGRRRIPVSLTPAPSEMPPGTTLAVDLTAERHDAELAIEVNARAEAVVVCGTIGRREIRERVFHAPRRTEVELLAETIESVGRDEVAEEALAMAAELAGPKDVRQGRRKPSRGGPPR